MTSVHMASTVRQPFASLDGARLHGLSSIKNRQNAAMSPSGSPKRRRERTNEYPDTSDFENVDPSCLKASPSKRGKHASGYLNKPVKSRFTLNKPASGFSKSYSSFPSLSKSKVETPKTSKHKTAPLAMSAPPAGRSPKSKHHGHLNFHKYGTPFSHIEPPNFTSKNAAPFSIGAALKGTIASYDTKHAKPAKHGKSTQATTLEKTVPNGWFFSIYEDSPEEEMANLMEHSTYTLDISDDESHHKKHDRGKENIPPLGYPTPIDTNGGATTSGAPAAKIPEISRKDAMIDEPRTPLGNLEASEFYAEGCDASTIVIVDEKQEEAEPHLLSNIPEVESEKDSNTTEKASEDTEMWKSHDAAADEQLRKKCGKKN